MGAQRRHDPEGGHRLAELADAWLRTHRSGNTRAAYGADLGWFAAWCTQAGHSPLGVVQGDVERFRADCESDGAGPAVTRRRLSALTSFFDYAVTVGEVIENPAAGVERPMSSGERPTAALDHGEAAALLDAAESLGPKAKVLVALLLLDGLKLGEALGIDVDALGAAPPSVTVTRQGRPVSVALHPTTATAIDGYMAGRTTGPLVMGKVLTEKGGAEPGRLTRAGAHHILKNATAHAGITTSVSANTLRRFFASSAYNDGASLDDIRASLGHYDRRTTRRLLPE